jgi:membrane protease YdiL (CAAX protease family)
MSELMGHPEKQGRGFFANFDVSVVVGLLLAAGFVITFATVGPWEAVRNFAVEAVILGAAFWVARTYLPWEDAPRERIKKPVFELAAGLAAYALLVYGAVRLFNGQSAWALLAAGMLIPVAVLLALRYSAAAWGLRLPRGRDWAVLAVVAALIVFAISRLADLFLPQGEVPAPAEVTLPGFAFGLAAVVVAAILQELFFRVYLQPRLAAFLSGRWALFWQAVLYNLMFTPMYLFANGYGLPYSLALTMVLTNGVLAGYFWRKTGSLPLLILLHLLAFSRWGL